MSGKNGSKCATCEMELPEKVLIIREKPSLNTELASMLAGDGFSVMQVSSQVELYLTLHHFYPDYVLIDDPVFYQPEYMKPLIALARIISCTVIILHKISSDGSKIQLLGSKNGSGRSAQLTPSASTEKLKSILMTYLSKDSTSLEGKAL